MEQLQNYSKINQDLFCHRELFLFPKKLSETSIFTYRYNTIHGDYLYN